MVARSFFLLAAFALAGLYLFTYQASAITSVSRLVNVKNVTEVFPNFEDGDAENVKHDKSKQFYESQNSDKVVENDKNGDKIANDSDVKDGSDNQHYVELNARADSSTLDISSVVQGAVSDVSPTASATSDNASFPVSNQFSPSTSSTTLNNDFPTSSAAPDSPSTSLISSSSSSSTSSSSLSLTLPTTSAFQFTSDTTSNANPTTSSEEQNTSSPAETSQQTSSNDVVPTSSDQIPTSSEQTSTSPRTTSAAPSTSLTRDGSSAVAASSSAVVTTFSSVANGQTIVVTQTSIMTLSSSEPSAASGSSSASSGGLSNTNKIVVGVVVGVGGAILLAIAAVVFWMRTRGNKFNESGWTFWRKNEKGDEDNFLSGELGVRERNINQGSNF